MEYRGKRCALLVVVCLLGFALAACSGQGASQPAASSAAPDASASSQGSASAEPSGDAGSQGSAPAAQDSSSQSGASAAQGADAYVGDWVSGRARLEISAVEDHYKCVVVWGASYKEEARWDYEPCLYDGTSLVCEGLGVKTVDVYKEGGELESSEEEFSDGSASFTLGDDGQLTWIDFKVYPDEEGLVFERIA